MDLPEAQGSCHARESKSGIRNLGIFDGGIRDPGLWNSEPRRRTQNLGLSSVLYSLKWGDREGDALTTDFKKLVFIDDFASLLFWTALLAMKVAFEETLISRGTQRQFTVKLLFGGPKVA